MKLILVFLGIFMMSISSVCNAQEKAKGPVYMTDTGTKGLDLYCLTEDGWRYVRCGKPNGKTSTMKAIENMTKEDREFMLYLSLYDGVSSLEIGVDPDAYIEQPQVDSPMYAHAMFDTKIHDIIVRKNEAQERLYKKLKKALK